MTNVLPLPTKRDESWRYGDLAALEAVWGELPSGPQQIIIPAGTSETRQIIQPVPIGGVAVTHLHVHLEAGAQMALHLLAADNDYGRMHIEVTLARGAHFELGGAIIGTGEQTLEIVTEITHAEPEATSNQVVRSVLGGRATGSFLGKVNVARHAQKTDAEQSFKAMLLERTATANAKPELEIFADDVQCAHGATVGELDKQALFYMASRGLDPLTARRLMLQAFIADAFVSVADDAARETIENRALEALEAIL
ncbi:SufD family Fe-S cluster assembly protein [Parasphingorhabdus sp. DH2-15]|uniref:SufD family Fe-S cluster assembly protein n=1 Tax=Parasphingorhabdus sp. DH2-15 TaxID=3444112 RepID=UPI003F686E04